MSSSRVGSVLELSALVVFAAVFSACCRSCSRNWFTELEYRRQLHWSRSYFGSGLYRSETTVA